MNKLNVSEKSKGVVLFAFNSAQVDYVGLADLASRLIEKNLNLPITLITDNVSLPKFNYDNVIQVQAKGGNYRLDKNNNLIQWKNFDRCAVYDLSPYQETLLLDTDYLVMTDSLLKLFDQPFDYRLMYKMHTLLEISDEEMGPASLPLVWATVVLFRKTQKSELFFKLIRRIQNNYAYYKTLYNMHDSSYRNDHAFSIANIILNGYSLDQHTSIPWPMLTVKDEIKELQLENNLIVIRTTNRAIISPKQDMHVMDKDYLNSNSFSDFVNGVSCE